MWDVTLQLYRFEVDEEEARELQPANHLIDSQSF